MFNKSLFSSKDHEAETPQELFDLINKEYPICFDLAASINNKKCINFYSLEQDSLKQDWDSLREYGETVYLNPPYGKYISPFIKKASETKNIRIVALLPARTDTNWFHNYIYKRDNCEIRFLKGRLKFQNYKESAPFPSMIVIFNVNLK